MKGVELASGETKRHHSRTTPLLHQQVKHVEFVVEVDIILDALLEAGLQDHVPGAVRGIAGAAHRSLAVLARVTAKGPLRDLAVGRAAERQPPVFEVIYGLDRLAAEDLGGDLVDEIIPALDGVKHVPFPVVFLQVAESGADASLGGACVRPHRVELADYRHASVRKLERGHQACSARSDDYRIILLIHGIPGSEPCTGPP